MATKFHTFTGNSPIEALRKAQEKCGDKAMLVTTKQIQPKTLNKEALFEILVSVEEDEILEKPMQSYKKQNPYLNQTNAKSNFISTAQTTKKSSDDVLLNISQATQNIKNVTTNTNDIKSVNNENYNKQIDNVSKKVNDINNKITMIADMFWDERAPSRNNLIIPPEFSGIYKAASKSGMKDEHLESIMKATIECMPTNIKTNPTAVKNFFYTFLRKMLPCRVNQRHDLKKQKIMMLVGPTGVGKTTTLAKLAARFAYIGDVRYKTGIITLDTYRIGAVEQLFQYAKLMKLPILDVIQIQDFKNAIKNLRQCDVILIDTIGSSQYDKEKLNKLDSFLKNSDADIDVTLVMSAGSKVEDMLEIYDNFSFLHIDTMIITKFDETKVFGNVFSLVYETKTPVSYFSIGQEVPDDLMEARSEFLIECVLEGFNKKDSDDKSSK